MERKKLVIESKAEELVAEIARVLRKVSYRCKASNDLAKSGDSLLLNLGEAVTAFKPKVKAAAYDVVRREAGEVLKALRALVLKGKLREADITKASDLADCIIAMATNLIKVQEART
jgi:four helix bundle protein